MGKGFPFYLLINIDIIILKRGDIKMFIDKIYLVLICSSIAFTFIITGAICFFSGMILSYRFLHDEFEFHLKKK
jgi:hypothetical protein